MNPIKIRYTWKRKSDGGLRQEIMTLEAIEPFGYTTGMELIARDLWTGKVDMFGNEIYGGDELSIPRKGKEPYGGTVIWDGFGWIITPNLSKIADSRSMVLAIKSTVISNIHIKP
jgi:hypothetical protein